MEEMATRIAFEMEKNTTSWVLSTAAGLYWRVKGRASEAVSCLRQRYFQLLKNQSSLICHQEVICESSETHQEVIRQSAGSHKRFISETSESHQGFI